MRSLGDPDTYAVLVAGIGNELLGDDGIGVEAARELASGALPQGVFVLVCGTAVAGCVSQIAAAKRVIFVDAVDGGRPPGSIYRIPEPLLIRTEHCYNTRSAHGYPITAALAEARSGNRGMPEEAALIGMQPYVVTEGLGLSSCAAKAMPGLIAAVRAEIARTTGTATDRTACR